MLASTLRAPSGRVLLLAFAAVAVAFVVSTVVVEQGEIGIRRAAQQITGNAAPSIQHLAELRGELRRLTLVEDDEVDRAVEGLPLAAADQVRAARAKIDGNWAAYHALPSFTGEPKLWPAAEQAKVALDRAVDGIDARLRAGDWRAARAMLDGALKPAADRLDETVLQIIDLNAGNGAKLARHIDALGRRSVRLAAVLDTVSVLLTVLTALLAVRVVRRYTTLVERRAEELELFAGRVAHDVLGPLGAASLALDVSEREAQPGSRVQRVVASGRAGLRRARTIADGLLEFARAGARPQPDDRAEVAEVIAAVADEVQPTAQERQMAVELDVGDVGAAACNAGVLTSIVSNLVRNAVKYACNAPGKRVAIRARRIGRRVRIEVEDDGPGLPPGLGDQAFEPYVRGAGSGQPGIGLGLATVKKITEAHGGRVDVRSAPGQGCRFGVELPLAPDLMARPTGPDGTARSPQEAVDRPAHAP